MRIKRYPRDGKVEHTGDSSSLPAHLMRSSWEAPDEKPGGRIEPLVRWGWLLLQNLEGAFVRGPAPGNLGYMDQCCQKGPQWTNTELVVTELDEGRAAAWTLVQWGRPFQVSLTVSANSFCLEVPVRWWLWCPRESRTGHRRWGLWVLTSSIWKRWTLQWGHWACWWSRARHLHQDRQMTRSSFVGASVTMANPTEGL